MIRANLLIILGYIWAAFGAYWIGFGLFGHRLAGSAPQVEMATRPGNPARSGELRFYRPLRLMILAITFALLFWSRTAVGFLGKRFLPETNSVAIAGFVIALFGIVLALWARIHLGKYWSDKVELKVDHQLIRTGPYSYLRHPIYSGILLGVAGTALLVGEWRGVLAFAILLVNYVIKAKREDRILAGTFADFGAHKRQAGFLLPNFRRRS